MLLVLGVMFGFALLASAIADRAAAAEQPPSDQAGQQAADGSGLLPSARDLVARVAPALRPVTEVLHPITDAAASVVEPVTGTLRPVAPVVAPLIDAVTTTVRPVTKALEPVTSVLRPVTDAVAPVTKPLGDAVARPVLGAVKPAPDQPPARIGVRDDPATTSPGPYQVATAATPLPAPAAERAQASDGVRAGIFVPARRVRAPLTVPGSAMPTASGLSGPGVPQGPFQPGAACATGSATLSGSGSHSGMAAVLAGRSGGAGLRQQWRAPPFGGWPPRWVASGADNRPG